MMGDGGLSTEESGRGGNKNSTGKFEATTQNEPHGMKK